MNIIIIAINGTELNFGHSVIIQSYLEFAFKLREK